MCRLDTHPAHIYGPPSMPEQRRRGRGGLRVEFDEADFQLLTDAAEAERLPKVEILRRALRSYAPKVLSEQSRAAAETTENHA